MRIKRNHFFEAANDDSAAEKKDEKDKTEKVKDETKKDESLKSATKSEEEKLKLELEAERKAREEVEAKLKERELAALTEEERKKAEADATQMGLLKGHEDLQLERLGLDESYRDLIHGNTAAEIKKKAEALKAVIGKTRTDAEAEVKKEVSKTIVPGGAGDSNNDGEMDSEDYFAEILGGKI